MLNLLDVRDFFHLSPLEESQTDACDELKKLQVTQSGVILVRCQILLCDYAFFAECVNLVHL